MSNESNCVISEVSLDDVMDSARVFVVRNFHPTGTASLFHPAVREILSRLVPIDECARTYLPSGKPYVELPTGLSLPISLAHAEDLLLVAVSTNGEVGVDVELIRPRKFAKRIIERYFDSTPKSMDEFYRAWTARESFVKLMGQTLGQGLSRICTESDGQELKIGFDGRFSHRVRFFTPGENFIAAICRAV